MKYALFGLIFGISMSVFSWIIGMVMNILLMKTKYYKRMSNFNFILNEKLNEIIGIKYFKWIVKNTFFKFFNQQLKVENRKTDLTELRNQMTISEISHLIGFVFVAIFAVYKCFSVNIVFGLTMMIGNTLLNLYPSLLQQENKRRIDKLFKKQYHFKH